jgi:hypothetical protein
MSFPLSPGITVREIDLTTVVPGVATSDAAYVAHLKWGPVDQINLISNEIELANRYGKPDNNTALHFFSAANFLAYSNRLHLVRVVNEASALNATAEDGTGSGNAGVGLLIKNDDQYDQNFSSGQADVGLFAAKFPGELGNSIRFSVCPSASAFSKILTGTIDSAGAVLSGSGTAFEDELEIGSIIVLPSGQEAKVVSIASQTSATISVSPSPALSAASLQAKWEYANVISVPPSTSDFVAARNGSNDEMHVVVVDHGGKFSGQAGTILEVYSFVSKAADAKKEDGTSNYYAEIINRSSQFIRWMDHIAGSNHGDEAENTSFDAQIKPYSFRLSGGADGNIPTVGEFIQGYDLFVDPETIDISLVIGGPADSVLSNHIIQNICESRKDCIAFVSPKLNDVLNNVGNELNDIISHRNTLSSSTYGVLDSGWKQQYDKYNDVFRWIPLNADIAGLCARTDATNDAWFSPAGYNRGQIKSVRKLAFNPNKANRDLLFVNGINPVISEPGEGVVLLGDKTLSNKPSAFDAINVRRLFIVLKKSISRASKASLFEFNDEITRAQFRNLVNPFLEDIQGRRGITDFRVVCDTTNNTGEVIDRNEFVGDIYIKPARAIRFVRLNFIAVRTNVDFDEIVGSF